MMNEQLYESLEQEFEKCHIGEEVEDVLLEMAESMADMGIMDKEVKCKESYGKTVVEACGVCTEEDEELSVLIRWITVGKKKFEIEDYFI